MLAAAAALLELLEHLIEREAAGLLPRRKLDVGLQVLAHVGLRRHEQVSALEPPVLISAGGEIGDFEGIGAQIKQLGEAQRHQRVLPHGEADGPLLQEQELPAVVTNGGEIAVVRPVEELLAWVFSFAGQETGPDRSRRGGP